MQDTGSLGRRELGVPLFFKHSFKPNLLNRKAVKLVSDDHYYDLV